MSNNRKSVDDYIQDGIYGAKEILPDERRKYLGTIRERIEYVLLQTQVREEEAYSEIEEAMKKNKNLKLFLNGNMSYSFLSKYIRLADKYKVSYTSVSNKEHNSEYGLVLAHEEAVDKERIEISKRAKPSESIEEKPSFFKRFFG
ncbi:YueI family protein [Jeotgalibacillus proteolyticus]|uniref:DUF1694 domain-containing protein n=1 Tax=Jeotgalibacillus proteolyticus TaxID=2082395 RepID=A0A2S5G7L5_9BACL|nr:YueI family protein [Jeotgalibacillus proteolyticus]PPA68968.1 DUF1694 domain-containing protein [Jeotgalibacillus proteolyticus]